MNVKEEIAKLIEVQEIDTKIFQIRADSEINTPKQVEELKAAFELKKKGLQEAEEKLKSAQLRKKEKELDLKTKEEGVHKAQTQLYQLKTNQEYHLKLKEIESLKADISVAEEHILIALEEIDKISSQLAREKETLTADEKMFHEQLGTLEKIISDLTLQLQQLEEKRSTRIREIDKRILQQYDRLLKNRNGLALVPLLNGTCGGCYMSMMDETINQIKQYKEIITCPSCARMVYLKEDFGG